MKYIYTTLTAPNDQESCYSQSLTYIRSGAEWNFPSRFFFFFHKGNPRKVEKTKLVVHPSTPYKNEPQQHPNLWIIEIAVIIRLRLQAKLLFTAPYRPGWWVNNPIASFHVSARAARFFSSFKPIMLLIVVKCVSHDNFSSFNQSCYWFVTLSVTSSFLKR